MIVRLQAGALQHAPTLVNGIKSVIIYDDERNAMAIVQEFETGKLFLRTPKDKGFDALVSRIEHHQKDVTNVTL